MLKQLQFRGIDDLGNISCLPLLDRGLEKTAAVDKMRSRLHPKIKDFVGAVRPSASGIYVLVNALGAGEYWGSNINGDLFNEKSLVHAPADWDQLSPEQMSKVGKSWDYGYPTFMNAYPYKHHQNKDSSRAFGRVDLAVWNPDMKRVELVVYLDRSLCKKFDAYDIIEKIEQGSYPDISMGCRVKYDVCTICGNKSKTRHDYCHHASTMMNKILPDGRKVAVRNDYPKFFDISFVFIGADKTAKVLAKLAQKGNQVCMGDFCTIPRNSAEVGEVFSKEAAPHTLQFTLAGMQGGALLGAIVGATRPLKTNKGGKQESRLSSTALGLSTGLSLGGIAGLAGGVTIDAIGNALFNAKFKKHASAGEIGITCPKCDHDQIFFNRGLQSYRCLECNFSTKDPADLEKTANDPIKKSIRIDGMDIGIEWLKGETREYKDKKTGAVKHSTLMKADYGYIKRTKDADGEELDCYVGPDRNSDKAFVIKQLKDDGSFDEHKVMLGYETAGDARDSYMDHMPSKRFGSLEGMSLTEFKKTNLKEAKELAKEAGACGCHGVGDDCGGSLEKFASLVFPGVSSKTASHKKVGEIIKSVPAGPFTREMLPTLERNEKDIPPDVLDSMSDCGIGQAASTSGMMGMVLKPREFQRIILIRMGERNLADDLDAKNMTFPQSKDVDESIPVDEGLSNGHLKELLQLLGIFRDRTIAAPALAHRLKSVKHSVGGPKASKTSGDEFMKKIAAAYNGYRRALVKKAMQIERSLTFDPLLRSDSLFGRSLVNAFAGGVEKTASTSALSPNSLAYLTGAFHDNRSLHTSDSSIVGSVAQLGALSEMSV